MILCKNSFMGPNVYFHYCFRTVKSKQNKQGQLREDIGLGPAHLGRNLCEKFPEWFLTFTPLIKKGLKRGNAVQFVSIH